MRTSLRTTIRAAFGLLAAVALSGAVLPAAAHADSDDGAGTRPASGSHGTSGSPSKSGFLFPVDGLAQNANVGVTSVSDRD
ncbi:hypothetical protein [Streptomyces monomycini]|uniref:hypothetical protein n=1 Tax=Streptomyces monomycini TaxID=371720 RepID=UPI0004ABC04F|nr:hypothetical protein [Streptomyces monomycini]